MTVRCANCRAEVGDATTCPACGTPVLSPQSVEQSDWRTDTAERSVGRPPVEPAPAASMPTAVRYPLYADELDVAADSGQPPQPPPAYAPAATPAYVDDDGAEADRGVPGWVAWVIVAVVLILVAVGGVWLLFSPGDDETAPEPGETLSVPPATDESSVVPETSNASDTPVSEPAPSGDPVDVASTATATAPQTAPPNEDAFGNRTTYVAANMLDGRPDTCWRMAGDGTGLELTFRLSSATAITRVGMINGYAKNAVVGGRNLNWYVGNRRVLMAQWVFDDGTTVDQPLGATKQMQTIDIGAPVTTSTVIVRLVSVSSPGTGRSARDYTAVSEVALVGVPSA